MQISCGPFHCAAVTADGALFTWGEGFGGKLGHGDQSSRAHPTQVRALGRACAPWPAHLLLLLVALPVCLELLCCLHPRLSVCCVHTLG